jgi:hypothetical protein
MWLCPSIRNYYHTSISKGVVVKFRFKPEDFSRYEYPANERPCDAFARCANELLDKAIAEAPVVYGSIGEYGSSWGSDSPGTFIQEHLTHKAVLFNIEEIVIKPPCKHEPATCTDLENGDRYFCQYCGIELKARWEAAE